MTSLLKHLATILPILVWAPSLLMGSDGANFQKQIAALEKEHGGRLGVAVLDTATDKRLGNRAGDRFAFCSTFKVLLAANVLSHLDSGKVTLTQTVELTKDDILSYAPVTSKHLADGKMTIGDLCAAAVEYSDNTAANLLFKTIGGPATVTHWLQSLGDKVTRLDRIEPALNSNIAGDPRDTTTPDVMVETLRRLTTGDALSLASRKQLIAWMISCRTGDARLRAGLDPAWKVGDKTGTGENGAANDVAIAWPPDRAPILIVVYYSGSTASIDEKSAVIAKVGRIITAALSDAK